MSIWSMSYQILAGHAGLIRSIFVDAWIWVGITTVAFWISFCEVEECWNSFCTPGSLILTGSLQNFTKCPIRFQNWKISSELFLEIFETMSVPSFWGTVMTSHVPWPHLKWIDHDKSSAFSATPVTSITAYQSQIIKRVFHFATLQQNQAEEAMTRQESLSVKSKALSHHMSQGRFSCKKGIL